MPAAEASIVVTLDIGGSAAKASAYDARQDMSLGSAAVPYPATRGQADQGLFDPDEWWAAALGALTALRETVDVPAGRYLGITVSAIRIPFVLINGDGDVVLPSLLNRDRRAAAQAACIAADFGVDDVYRVTGHWPAPEFGLPKLLWVRQNNPAAWPAAQFVLQLHDWFIYKLSGVIATEPSAAAMSQMLDVRSRQWAVPLLTALGMPPRLLPELRAAGTCVGGLLPEVGRGTGFLPGTPVYMGGGDTHLSAESAGASEQGVPVVVAGTTAPVLVTVPCAELPGEVTGLYPLLLSEHVVPGRWALETNAGVTGGTFHLLGGLAGETGERLRNGLRERGLALAGGPAEAELTVLAGNPFFGPEGWATSPPPTVIGLLPTHTGADVADACLRAICYALRSMLGNLVRRSGIAAPLLIATGGMTRNALWAQLLADVTGIEVRVRPLDEIAGRAGAALIAGEELHPGAQGAPAILAPRTDLASTHEAGYATYLKLHTLARSTPTPTEADPCSR
jgi:xylulokinase